MRIVSGREAEAMVERLAARGARFTGLEPRVRRIVNDVRRGGERSLRRYAERWDGLAAKQSLRVSEEEMAAAWQTLAPKLAQVFAASRAKHPPFLRVAEAHRLDADSRWNLTRADCAASGFGGLLCAGRALPAGFHRAYDGDSGAGCGREEHPRGVAQAVGGSVGRGCDAAACASFTAWEGRRPSRRWRMAPAAFRGWIKLLGPGNAYVTAAKKLVAFDCAIDFLAGPTEAVILYNSLSDSLSDSSVPEFIAADLVAQAEHDPETLAVFITTSRELARAVRTTVAQFAKNNPIAQKSLLARGAVLVAASRKQARDWANRLAPEHITIAEEDLPFIQNAGSVFVGDYSAQAAGDYASGPNHVLPTSGQARFRGGLSVMDFVKVITVQQLSAGGLKRIAPAIECLAEAEGLAAHARSIRVRREHA